MLFNWFKSSEKPNIYLGSLAVASEGKLSQIEKLFSITNNSLQDHMRHKLQEVFCLDSVANIKDPKRSDIGLDVVIVTLHGGNLFAAHWDTGAIPIFWRPKIKLVSRL